MTDAELDQHRIALAQASADAERLHAFHLLAQSRWSQALIEQQRLQTIIDREEAHRAWLKEYEAGLRGEPAPAAPKEATS